MSKLQVPVSSSDHLMGSAEAPLILVEYGDYECPYCGRAFNIVTKLQEEFGDDLGFVFRNFPLHEIHPNAMSAARAAEAAGLQGQFWTMHQYLFRHQGDLDDEGLLTAATAVDISLEAFVRDISGPAVVKKIRADIEGGERSGVNGTPTFFINGLRYTEDWTFEPFRRHLESMLRVKSAEAA